MNNIHCAIFPDNCIAAPRHVGGAWVSSPPLPSLSLAYAPRLILLEEVHAKSR